jgi:hypothetical protein
MIKVGISNVGDWSRMAFVNDGNKLMRIVDESPSS